MPFQQKINIPYASRSNNQLYILNIYQSLNNELVIVLINNSQNGEIVLPPCDAYEEPISAQKELSVQLEIMVEADHELPIKGYLISEYDELPKFLRINDESEIPETEKKMVIYHNDQLEKKEKDVFQQEINCIKECDLTHLMSNSNKIEYQAYAQSFIRDREKHLSIFSHPHSSTMWNVKSPTQSPSDGLKVDEEAPPTECCVIS